MSVFYFGWGLIPSSMVDRNQWLSDLEEYVVFRMYHLVGNYFPKADLTAVLFL